MRPLWRLPEKLACREIKHLLDVRKSYVILHSGTIQFFVFNVEATNSKTKEKVEASYTYNLMKEVLLVVSVSRRLQFISRVSLLCSDYDL